MRLNGTLSPQPKIKREKIEILNCLKFHSFWKSLIIPTIHLLYKIFTVHIRFLKEKYIAPKTQWILARRFNFVSRSRITNASIIFIGKNPPFLLFPHRKKKLIFKSNILTFQNKYKLSLLSLLFLRNPAF